MLQNFNVKATLFPSDWASIGLNNFWDNKHYKEEMSPDNNLFHSLTSQGASLTALLVKNLPAMPETRVQFGGREIPLEKGLAIHS